MFKLGYRKFFCYPVLILAHCMSHCIPWLQIALRASLSGVVHHSEDFLVVALDQQCSLVFLWRVMDKKDSGEAFLYILYGDSARERIWVSVKPGSVV